MRPIIIAEAGVNHNGSLELAKKLIDVACEAKADIVKFQTFSTEKLVTKQAEKSNYQKKSTTITESQFSMLKKLELTKENFKELKKYCDARNIEFLSTAFDSESLDFLVKEVGIKRLKIPSGELTNAPLLLHASRLGLPIIISTGMSTISDIELALDIICYGMTYNHEPKFNEFIGQRNKPSSKEIISSSVTILQCTTEYPAPDCDVNLRVIPSYAQRFLTKTGLSDHSSGITAALGAVALGASLIEKHFTLDKELPGPDHAASLSPQELKFLVNEVHRLWNMMGEPDKKISSSEKENIIVARKSLMASRTIKRGEYFDKSNLCVKRPGHGLSPFQYWEILGKKSEHDYNADEMIKNQS